MLRSFLPRQVAIWTHNLTIVNPKLQLVYQTIQIPGWHFLHHPLIDTRHYIWVTCHLWQHCCELCAFLGNQTPGFEARSGTALDLLQWCQKWETTAVRPPEACEGAWKKDEGLFVGVCYTEPFGCPYPIETLTLTPLKCKMVKFRLWVWVRV